jgi:hypothetical protein
MHILECNFLVPEVNGKLSVSFHTVGLKGNVKGNGTWWKRFQTIEVLVQRYAWQFWV